MSVLRCAAQALIVAILTGLIAGLTTAALVWHVIRPIVLSSTGGPQ